MDFLFSCRSEVGELMSIFSGYPVVHISFLTQASLKRRAGQFLVYTDQWTGMCVKPRVVALGAVDAVK